jgi:hypothetical protein
VNYGVASLSLFYCGRRGIKPGARSSPAFAAGIEPTDQRSIIEDELGLKLLTRNSRGVELTEAGRVFLMAGRRVLVAAKDAAERAQEAAKGDSGSARDR